MKTPITPALYLMLSICVIFNSCKKSDKSNSAPITLATISTTAAASITRNVATVGGTISSTGGGSLTEIGVCFNTSPTPTVANTVVVGLVGSNSFSLPITNLNPNTTYYVRAYATNSAGTVYGNEISFTTLPISAPTITTNAIVSTTTIFGTTTTSNITDDGGSPVFARGICWSSAHMPTILDNPTTDGTGAGGFNSSLTGLAGNTTYYIRAYAKNAIGIAYSDTVTIATDVEGNVYNTVKIGTQIWMRENLKTTKYNDGSAILLVTDDAQWSLNFAVADKADYCWYDNDISNKNVYGAMYDWLPVSTGKLAPTGWHVPSHADFVTLIKYLDPHYSLIIDTLPASVTGTVATPIYMYQSNTVGGQLKETGTAHWQSPNTGATNASGFTAVGGGFRNELGGSFAYFNQDAGWWSSTAILPNNLYRLAIFYSAGGILYGPEDIPEGLSVRCIKN